ncbi:HAMP domain-containing sensor histidine kinase [Flavobacterium sp.]|uniref:sensor histidine kinase n=1 Tax=Flavobacterium sp. TaxID=239 RepID=UPI00261D901D|nr:HAMP domain-containing sensor histidine kinase [Flavobacterium sp.]MDG2433406.1 HAMP domain-containing sensor histidine kinase [Flavobacterium sp.]
MLTLKWKSLIGTEDEFSLEQRIFHGFCLITALVLLICFPSNFLIGLDILGYLLVVVLCFLLTLYYFSRFKRKSKLLLPIYICFTYTTLVIGYSLNCGIDGPMILVFGITFLILAAIIEEKNLVFWMLFHLFVAFTLLYLEYNYPDLIYVIYDKKSFRFFDIALTLSILLLTILFTIKYLKINYNKQLLVSNKKNEELHQANATKDKLFSIISHDLRSPFNALIGLSQLLKESSADLTDSEKEEFVDGIYETSKKTYSLLQNLLEWSLSQTNEIQFLPEKINLKAFLSDALLLSFQVAKSKEIGIQITIPDDATITADKNMLETVLRNIISNAIKFTAAKGKISISSSSDAAGVTLSIADNGIGMSEATVASLFSKSNLTTQQELVHDRGLGLGLLLCKDFIERHDGKIWAESRKGIGSTFFIFIKK